METYLVLYNELSSVFGCAFDTSKYTKRIYLPFTKEEWSSNTVEYKTKFRRKCIFKCDSEVILFYLLGKYMANLVRYFFRSNLEELVPITSNENLLYQKKFNQAMTMNYIWRYLHRWFLLRGQENRMELSSMDIQDMIKDVINDIHNYRDLVSKKEMSFETVVDMITECDTANHVAYRFENFNVNFFNAQGRNYNPKNC